jgi:hypothetical protein
VAFLLVWRLRVEPRPGTQNGLWRGACAVVARLTPSGCFFSRVAGAKPADYIWNGSWARGLGKADLEMADFARWSRWFECGLELKREKTRAMAMMAWIAAHASNDGSGLEFDDDVWDSLADEIGLTPEEGHAALDVLIGEGLVTAVGQETSDRFAIRAVI